MTYRMAKGYPNRFFLLPLDILRKMEEAGDRELRILIHAAAILSQGPKEVDLLIDALAGKGFFPEEIRSALAFWRGCGILSVSGKEDPADFAADLKKEKTVPQEAAPQKKMVDADEVPFYSSLELGKAAEENEAFRNVVDYAQKKLNKIFNTSELAKIWSFLDYLKMPPEVVMMAIEDCCNREKTSLRYIAKMLNSFQDEGIDSYEKAEAYFLSREEKNQYQKYVRKLFGLGDRKLSSSEEEMLHKWQFDWNFGQDLLDAAFEKTVASAKTPSVKYMHRILENWHENGVKTPMDVEKQGNSQGGKAEKSYDSEDFFQAAVAKGLKNV